MVGVGSFPGYLMLKPSLQRNKGFFTIAKYIDPKVNAVARLGFDLTYFKTKGQTYTYYVTGIPSIV